MTIRQQGGIFGRNPVFANVEAESLDVSGQISGSRSKFTGTAPRIDILETDGGAGYNQSSIVRDANRLAFQTLNSGAFVSNDYRMESNATGVIYHEWRIGNVTKMTLNSSGNLNVVGALSKGSGSFKIDHPLKPDTHHLVHSFVEGPQADNLYRGRVVLVAGHATIDLDDAARMSNGTFAALNGNVQCFTSNESGWTAVRGNINGNILTIEAQDAACADMVSWLVIGERQDQHMIDADWTNEDGRVIVEPKKEGCE